MNDILESDIKFLPGIGPRRAELLARELDIHTFRDMLYTVPFRYVDRSRVWAISEIEPTSAYIQLRGRITRINTVGERRGQRLVARLDDGTGCIDLVFFQGMKWVSEKLSAGKEYMVFGKPSVFNGAINMVHPEIDPVNEATVGNLTMTGIYSSTEKLRNGGITNKVFSRCQAVLLEKCLDCIPESLPEGIIKDLRLIRLREALKTIHFPTDMQSLSQAQFRLKFEELFYLQLSLLKQKNIRMRDSSGVMIHKVGQCFNFLFNGLRFPLTGAQKRVIKEIFTDFKSGRQMNRLLQGDVGSGKTLVALLSAMLSIDNGYQACIMAPTEVLANQHYTGALRLLEGSPVKCALLTGSTKKKDRKVIDEGLRDGSIHLLFGTHAVIEDTVVFKNLGFAVIDEQHRFGVDQRARIRFKSDIPPHVLVMTATPIPRTLAMTLYGDLDVSVLDEMPPGRKPVLTTQAREPQRARVFEFMRQEIDRGRQVFIVYPLIKESEKMDYKNLEEGYQVIVQNFPAPKYITAVVHGQQTNENKAYDMKLFAEGRAHILVATSVIEVGVDVPNASVMVIESAERFGLSQLHQLRGRVGRGAEKSYCILMTGYKLSKESQHRIELMCSTNDGFELAEEDMKMRGPGDIEGTQQSGLAVPLRVADLSRDSQILNLARQVAQRILDEDPLLESPDSALLRRQLSYLKDLPSGVDYSKIS